MKSYKLNVILGTRSPCAFVDIEVPEVHSISTMHLDIKRVVLCTEPQQRGKEKVPYFATDIFEGS